jgi:hypothetical protein
LFEEVVPGKVLFLGLVGEERSDKGDLLLIPGVGIEAEVVDDRFPPGTKGGFRLPIV